MKTTFDVDAAQQRISLTQLIEEALRLRLRSSALVRGGGRHKIPVFKRRGGLVAGVNPASNKSMLDAADGDA